MIGILLIVQSKGTNIVTHLVHVDMKIPEFRIEPKDDFHYGFVALEHQKDQQQQIDDRKAEYNPPHGRMRSRKWSIRESQHRYDQKEEYHA